MNGPAPQPPSSTLPDTAGTATQLDLELAEREIPATALQPSVSAATDPEVKRTRFRIPSLIAAAFFLLVSAALLRTEEPGTDITGNFTAVTPAAPVSATRNLPELDFSPVGEMLQIGIFKNLAGAESKQTELTSLGLYPHIEKRSRGGAILYAVVIGPLNRADHRATLAKLDTHGFRYFHRKRDT